MPKKISEEFIVSLRGKEYPLYAGVLSAATEEGLYSLEVTPIQLPTEENGQMAIVLATAKQRLENGTERTFTDVGDCSPRSTSQQLASAVLRLASTRAKGRVLRDMVNVGQTLLEELPDLSDVHLEEAETKARQVERVAPNVTPPRVPPRVPTPDDLFCSTPNCGKPLTRGQYEVSLRTFQHPFCPTCQKEQARLQGLP